MGYAAKYLQEVAELLVHVDAEEVEAARRFLLQASKDGGQIFVIGNGGSAATAAHFTCDLYKRCGFRARSLTASMPLFSALGNDLGYEHVFAWQVAKEMGPQDCLVAISASGNSPNILEALSKAKDVGGKTLGLVGFDGGKLIQMVDRRIWVRSDFIEQVEDAHGVICHLLACYLRESDQ